MASLTARDRQVKPIIGDGNCLFRAIGFVLYGTEMAHEKVRELLVQFVSENRGSFRPYIDGDIETYLAKMKYTRVWGTAVELLAVTALLQIPVFTLIPHVKYLQMVPL